MIRTSINTCVQSSSLSLYFIYYCVIKKLFIDLIDKFLKNFKVLILLFKNQFTPLLVLSARSNIPLRDTNTNTIHGASILHASFNGDKKKPSKYKSNLVVFTSRNVAESIWTGFMIFYQKLIVLFSHTKAWNKFIIFIPALTSGNGAD